MLLVLVHVGNGVSKALVVALDVSARPLMALFKVVMVVVFDAVGCLL